MTSKIFGIPLILIILVLLVVIPLGYGEIIIIQKQNALQKIVEQEIVNNLIAQPVEIEPTVTPEKPKVATKAAEPTVVKPVVIAVTPIE